MKNSFIEYLLRKKKEYGADFEPDDLNPDFIPAFQSGERITVNFGFTIKRGTVGVTTGHKPVFILMLTKRSIGSGYILDKTAKIV